MIYDHEFFFKSESYARKTMQRLSTFLRNSPFVPNCLFFAAFICPSFLLLHAVHLPYIPRTQPAIPTHVLHALCSLRSIETQTCVHKVSPQAILRGKWNTSYPNQSHIWNNFFYILLKAYYKTELHFFGESKMYFLLLLTLSFFYGVSCQISQALRKEIHLVDYIMCFFTFCSQHKLGYKVSLRFGLAINPLLLGPVPEFHAENMLTL